MKKALIFGYGIQGKKRSKILKQKKIPFVTIDPENKNADFKSIKLINKDILKEITHTFICTPYNQRLSIIKKILNLKTKILIEKPGIYDLKEKNFFLKNFNKLKKRIYIGYNHRYEDCIKDLKKNLKSVGKIYSISMTYGNGTINDVKRTKWKKIGRFGVGMDLLPHLYDLYYYLFGNLPNKKKLKLFTKSFENQKYDYIKILFKEKIISNFFVSYLHWKNFFEIHIMGSKGYINLTGLPKWKECQIVFGKRIYPSGKPKIIKKKYKNIDLTWKRELKNFLENKFHFFNIKKEIKIYELIYKC
jgi:predicted dehydrogenase